MQPRSHINVKQLTTRSVVERSYTLTLPVCATFVDAQSTIPHFTANCSRPSICASQFSRPFKMIYEMRIYTTIPGRLPNLLARFENHTLKLWEKHGIKQVGFWYVLQPGAPAQS